MNHPTKKRRITRSDNKVIAGVLAGFGEYFDLDPLIIRVIFVVLSIFSAGFPTLVLYLILWIALPKKSDADKS